MRCNSLRFFLTVLDDDDYCSHIIVERKLLLTTITALSCYYCAKSRGSRNIVVFIEMLGPSSSSRMIVQELTGVEFF